LLATANILKRRVDPALYFGAIKMDTMNYLIQNFFILIVIYHGIKRLIKSVKDKRDPPKNEPFDVAT
jgi:hypothetical protein